jgi:hypothetical protein
MIKTAMARWDEKGGDSDIICIKAMVPAKVMKLQQKEQTLGNS